MDETNFLSLIRPWLDNICQITMKSANFSDLNRSWVEWITSSCSVHHCRFRFPSHEQILIVRHAVQSWHSLLRWWAANTAPKAAVLVPLELCQLPPPAAVPEVMGMFGWSLPVLSQVSLALPSKEKLACMEIETKKRQGNQAIFFLARQRETCLRNQTCPIMYLQISLFPI
jgi:hypothetical protein